MRIIVKYGSRRLRHLPMKTKAEGASVPTTCEIKPELEKLIGSDGTGENIDYNCTDEAPEGAGTITEAVIDTSAPLFIGSEEVKANEISFSTESQVSNIAGATKSAIILKDSTVYDENNKLILSGLATP